jgi:hypothetical protein
MKDFTHEIYTELLKILQKKGYQFITVFEYFMKRYDITKPFIMMRHDVDRYPKRSLAMAKLEHDLGVKSTYYFRTIPQTLKADIIQEIASLGHEIAYHYESLAEHNGNYEKAIKDFEENLERLRKLYPVRNIAMHGRPTSKWDSRLLWNRYNYKKFGIVIEPYFDIDFNEVFYTTDAGRAWSNETINLRDKVNTRFEYKFAHTKELIELIEHEELPKKLMINIHPEHWAQNETEWLEIFLIRKAKNFVKEQFLHKKM